MKNSKPLPSLERLHQLLLLDPSSPSGLRWKVTVGPKATAGKIAGSPSGRKNSGRSWGVQIDKDRFLAHRIVYFMHHGISPGQNQIDHRDGNVNNNHPENLRLADFSLNSRNKPALRNNISGYRGIYKIKDQKRTKPYRCKIWLSSEKEITKYFKTLEEAIEQRKMWEEEYFPGVYAREN